MITTFNDVIEAQLRHFDLTRTQEEISALEVYNHAKKFSERVVKPLDEQAYAADRFPHHLWRKLGNEGLKGMLIPKEYGGQGLGYLDFCLSSMEIARASGAIAVSYICDQALCSRQIATFGSEEQKSKFLPLLASGEHVGALAMSEPEAGSDVMSMRTSAQKVKGGYLINGSKTWITNGGRFDPKTGQNLTADVLVLYAKSDSHANRLTTFIVESGTNGFGVDHIIEKDNARGSDNAQLVFQDCFIPEENILGEADKGSHVLMAGLNAERLAFSANNVGVAQAALEDARDYTSQRKQFDLPIAFNQDVAHKLSEMFSQVSGVQTQMLLCADMADKNLDSLSNITAASVFKRSSVVASTVTEQARYLHGGNGQTTAYRVGRLEGIASLLRVGAGSEAIRDMRIAQSFIPNYLEYQKSERKMRAQLKYTL